MSWPTTRFAADPASTASPAAAARTAATSRSAGASLRRKPAAPAESASCTLLSVSKVVRTTIATGALAARSRPSPRGSASGGPSGLRPGQPLDQPDRFLSVRRLAHDFESRLGAEIIRRPVRTSSSSSASSTRTVMSAAVGETASTRNPPDGSGPASTVPPKRWARSRIPISPCPAPAGSAGAAAPEPWSAIVSSRTSGR